MKRADYVTFIRRHRWAVQASVNAAGGPQAAVIGVVATDHLELFFDTLAGTRKYQNLTRDPRIALAIGWDEGQTVQYEGVVDEPRGDELQRLKDAYFAVFPDGRERERWPGCVWLRVRPTWVRYSDFRGGGMVVHELAPADLAR